MHSRNSFDEPIVNVVEHNSLVWIRCTAEEMLHIVEHYVNYNLSKISNIKSIFFLCVMALRFLANKDKFDQCDNAFRLLHPSLYIPCFMQCHHLAWFVNKKLLKLSSDLVCIEIVIRFVFSSLCVWFNCNYAFSFR